MKPGVSVAQGRDRIGGSNCPDHNPARSRRMIKVETAKWQQTVEDLRRASLHEAHPRSRERFQALYLIASGQLNATACAAHIGRQDETLLPADVSGAGGGVELAGGDQVQGLETLPAAPLTS